MSAKWKLSVILLFSIFATAGGLYILQHQPRALITGTANGQQQTLSVENKSSELVVYPERSHYKTIPLESINSLLQGSDPKTLALNILYDVKSLRGQPAVEVTYPQPNQALVMITEVTPQQDKLVSQMRYRVELRRFGRSLLVSSPPVWQVIWAGSQVQCSPKTTGENCQ
jgi:hypothetical protein